MILEYTFFYTHARARHSLTKNICHYFHISKKQYVPRVLIAPSSFQPPNARVHEHRVWTPMVDRL